MDGSAVNKLPEGLRLEQDGTMHGTLKHGLRIGDTVHKDFVMHEALAEDMFAAESDATAERPMSFRAALIARQLVRIGTFEGPFSLAMLGKLKAADMNRLVRAQLELDKAGEA
ncbi:hypothetical protein [Stenotrophomonas sp. PS02298]|uniref:hypothetical protein n=1 Tax=Stenotrophomonas sp. PS02298 TaxID=2991424 RepID=UPI00249A389B|nr:hypothetical protein [Stenotrophomonas sp. PS02298]